MIAQYCGQVVGMVFFLFYAYQFFYLAVSLWKRKRRPSSPTVHRRIAVLIAARNEETVIGQLIDSVKAQDYPADRYGVFVVADNCTDNTAGVASAHGATVFCRHNLQQIGKGYALHYLLEGMEKTTTEKPFDAFLVLDADNLLAPGYLAAIDRSLGQHRVVTGYRHSKNYGDNWISAGYALWFLRESQQLNRARARLGISCVVSGTGFAFTREVLLEQGGWPFHSLTEDTEFTAARMCAGETIGYCEEAVLYDEQPVTFSQSFRQRLRWAKGYFQILRRYGGRLFRGISKGYFACYDLIASILPAFVLSIATLVVDVAEMVILAVTGQNVLPTLMALLQVVSGSYGTLLLLGGVTLATEWRHIRVSWQKKLGYFLLFPLFMLTYVPIAITAVFCHVEWTPVVHTRGVTMEQLRDER